MNFSLSLLENGFNNDISLLWQQAYNTSPDLMAVVDIHHRIVSINHTTAQVLQCSAQQAVGQYCYRLFHQSSQPPKDCPHRALLENGQQHYSEIYEERLDLWIHFSVIPLFDDKNKLIGSFHIGRDITAQKKIEQALRESKERFRHLSEATLEGVLLSEDSCIIAANQVLADMVGYSLNELRGMNLLKLVHPDDRPRLIEYLRRNRRSGVYDFQCIRKNGTVFPIEAHTRAIAYKGIMVYQTAIRDLTEQKRIEQQHLIRERMQGVLEMAGAVCHEFNQPLMALQGFMDIAHAQINTPEKLTSLLKKMHEQIDRLRILTRKLTRITHYKSKVFSSGDTIIDIDQATSDIES